MTIPRLDAAALTKLGVAVVSFCGAVYFEFSPPPAHDGAHAMALFTAALAALGWTAEGAKGNTERAAIRAGQAEIGAKIEAVDAKTDDLHRVVNSAMTAKDARTDGATQAAADAAKLSADADATTAADRIAYRDARIAELEKQIKDLRGDVA